MNTFFVVVRKEPAQNGPDKNNRFNLYSEALKHASELACKQSVDYIILQALDVVSPKYDVSVMPLIVKEAHNAVW